MFAIRANHDTFFDVNLSTHDQKSVDTIARGALDLE